MSYALVGLGKGGGHGGGRHGRHGGGRWHGRGFGRRGGGWWGGGWGPGYVDYYSYSPCDECWGQPPALYLNCLRYYGCPVLPSSLYGLGQTSAGIPVTLMGITGTLAVGAGLMWWLKSRRKKKTS